MCDSMNDVQIHFGTLGINFFPFLSLGFKNELKIKENEFLRYWDMGKNLLLLEHGMLEGCLKSHPYIEKDLKQLGTFKDWWIAGEFELFYKNFHVFENIITRNGGEVISNIIDKHKRTIDVFVLNGITLEEIMKKDVWCDIDDDGEIVLCRKKVNGNGKIE